MKALEASLGPELASEFEGEEAEDMSNYGEYVYQLGVERGFEQGHEEGVEQGVLVSTRNLMGSMGLNAQQALDALMVPKAEQEKFLSPIAATAWGEPCCHV